MKKKILVILVIVLIVSFLTHSVVFAKDDQISTNKLQFDYMTLPETFFVNSNGVLGICILNIGVDI